MSRRTRHARAASTLLVLALVAAGGCADEGSATGSELASACGVIACEAPDDNDPDIDGIKIDNEIGKADAVDRVARAVAEITADGVLSLDDVAPLFAAAGKRISAGEIRAIRDALDSNTTYTIDADAMAEARFRAYTANLSEVEADYLRDGYSYGGTELPQAVLDAVTDARLGGAVAYDVNERDDDGELVWSPYPATTPATYNMAFDYTEITPRALQDDMDDVDVVYNAIIGTETATLPDGREYERAKYEERKGGTGHVLSHYDHVYHPDIYARGSQGQKWANNMAILSDGTVHCLPAARRSYVQDLILTNPHLSRGARMLFNGHLDIRAGVVEGIEMSGRLSKLAAKGKAIFIDPIPLLEAWGFEISDHVRLRFGNTRSGTPVQHDGIIEEGSSVSTY